MATSKKKVINYPTATINSILSKEDSWFCTKDDVSANVARLDGRIDEFKIVDASTLCDDIFSNWT